MTDTLQFVNSLVEIRKSLGAWGEIETAQRVRVLLGLREFISLNADRISRELATSQGLPQKFLLETEVRKACQVIEAKIQDVTDTPAGLRGATGVVLILSPARLGFRFQIEMVASAWLAGNVVILKPSKKDRASENIFAEILTQLIQEFSEKEMPRFLLNVFPCGNEVADLMVSHPAINGVILQGKKETAERILSLTQNSWKKLMLMSGFHNSALVLPDADLSKVVPELVKSCFLGMGQLRWNISNILVTESQLPEFEKLFTEELEKNSFGAYLPGEEEIAEKTLSQLKGEEKRIVWQGKVPGIKAQPLVVRDLSHCSVLQQDCLLAPAVLISPVKYVHEMAKWANTGYYAQAAQIFGSTEKANNVAKKIDAGVIFINNWYESLHSTGFGYKQSSYGILDVSPIGKFFSNAKNLTN